MSYLLKRVDFFKRDLPTFNLRGQSKISTIYGGIATVMLATIMLLYAGIKLKMLANRENPNISKFTEEFILNSDERLNLKAAGMRFAWTFEGYSDRIQKNDPRFVK